MVDVTILIERYRGVPKWLVIVIFCTVMLVVFSKKSRKYLKLPSRPNFHICLKGIMDDPKKSPSYMVSIQMTLFGKTFKTYLDNFF